MASIFDQVPSPKISSGYLAGTQAAEPSPQPAAAPETSGTAAFTAALLPGHPPAAAAAPTAATGLLAAVSADVFERLVRDTVDPVVLYTTVRGAVMADRKRATSQPPALAHRYVLACAGMVFACTNNRPIEFGGAVRVIPCAAILYEGRPLGRDEATI
jgi:hypothetical protein